MPMKRNESLHTFAMGAAFAHEDEGTAEASPSSVVSVMNNAKETFPGIVTAHQLARSLDVILEPRGFKKDTTLLATSFSCDEVNRDLEDELRSVYGQNFALGGLGGFPFGGVTAFGALCHHIPLSGQCIVVYGPHVGIDFDGVIGKVNRRGHHGSGACSYANLISFEYVKAVRDGNTVDSTDPSDPIDSQQVFINNALLEHTDRLLSAENPAVELPHAIYDCIDALLKRITDKCLPGDLPAGVPMALLGGVQVNTPEGTPDYFLPKKFNIINSNGDVEDDLLSELISEGNKDIKSVLLSKRLAERTERAKEGLVDVPVMMS